MKYELIEVEPGVFSVLMDGLVYEARVDSGIVTIAGQRYEIEQIDPRKYKRRGTGAIGTGRSSIKAPMPGKIVRVLVSVGETVQAGQGIAVVEAMKMQNEIKAAGAGSVTSVAVKDGDTVDAGAVLAVIE
jgi:biotin carboxyl carrier protein